MYLIFSISGIDATWHTLCGCSSESKLPSEAPKTDFGASRKRSSITRSASGLLYHYYTSIVGLVRRGNTWCTFGHCLKTAEEALAMDLPQQLLLSTRTTLTMPGAKPSRNGHGTEASLNTSS